MPASESHTTSSSRSEVERRAVLGEHLPQRGLVESRAHLLEMVRGGAREDLGHDAGGPQDLAAAVEQGHTAQDRRELLDSIFQQHDAHPRIGKDYVYELGLLFLLL